MRLLKPGRALWRYRLGWCYFGGAIAVTTWIVQLKIFRCSKARGSSIFLQELRRWAAMVTKTEKLKEIPKGKSLTRYDRMIHSGLPGCKSPCYCLH